MAHGLLTCANPVLHKGRETFGRPGIAHVYLQGFCAPKEKTYTIAQMLMVNLKQFPQIEYVKIYDENGTTQNPDGSMNSILACLAP